MTLSYSIHLPLSHASPGAIHSQPSRKLSSWVATALQQKRLATPWVCRITTLGRWYIQRKTSSISNSLPLDPRDPCKMPWDTNIFEFLRKGWHCTWERHHSWEANCTAMHSFPQLVVLQWDKQLMLYIKKLPQQEQMRLLDAANFPSMLAWILNDPVDTLKTQKGSEKSWPSELPSCMRV